MQRFFKKGISLILILSVFFTFSISPAFAAVTYLYDANGNMTSDGEKCYQYNEANQLDKVTKCSNGQTIAEYVYDYNGTRLVKKEFENGVLKKTVYSPADEYETVKQATSGATANTSYYKANDETIAKKNPDGSITYYHNDHLGSSAVLANQAGALVEKTTFEPYGEVKSGGTKSKFGYTGQEQDNETGLDYYGARYYNPHIQRFTQPDTYTQDIYDPQDLNSYSYVRNNPIKYTDPSGHFAVLLAFAAIGALAAGVDTYLQVQNHAQATNQNFFAAAFDPKFNLNTDEVATAGLLSVTVAMTAVEVAMIGPTAVIGGTAGILTKNSTQNRITGGINSLVTTAVKAQQRMQTGKVIAGAGNKTPINDINRIVKTYGGKPNEWTKKTSTHYTDMFGKSFQTHWYENIKTKQKVEFKTKDITVNKK